MTGIAAFWCGVLLLSGNVARMVYCLLVTDRDEVERLASFIVGSMTLFALAGMFGRYC